MSLQVWLPLTRDLRNQGIGSTSVITLTSGNELISGGKVGNKAIYLTKMQTILGTSSCMSGKKQMSYAFWVKVNTAWPTQWLDGIRWISTDGSTTHTSRQEFYTNCTNIGTWFSGSSLSGYTFTPEEWTHLAGTFDYTTGIAKFYINGVLKGTSTALSKTHYCRGDFYIGDSGVDIVENDVRIYDHCLSEKEVKELSKGLVLHYPLNRQGWGQENLLLNTNTPATWSQGVNSSNYAVHDCFKTQSPVPSLFSVDELITISFDWSTTATGGNFHVECGAVTPWVWGTVISSKGTRNSASNYIDITSSNQSGHVEITFKITSNQTGAADTLQWLRIRHDGADTANKIFTISNAKLERGSIATPWCPNSSNALATTMGLNGTIEYDCSGFGNNGTRTGTFSWTSDTPKYKVSTHIGSTSSKIHILDFPTSGFGNSYSFAWWGKRSSNSPMFWGFSDGIRLNGMYIGTLWNTGDGSNNPLYKIGTTTQVTAPTTGVWHHYVMTGNGIKCYVYLDGELWAEAKSYKAINGTSIYINGWNDTISYCSDNTDISDFRIYATALSADDVKSLYQNSAYIDTVGNIYGKIR